MITVLPIIAMVLYILTRGMPAISWTFLTAMPSDGMRAGGIFPAIVGTFYLTLGTAHLFRAIGDCGGDLSGRICFG